MKSSRSTYFEITTDEHGHGGAGWEFGRCLWSPYRNKANHDRYSLMREPRPGDRVIHIYLTKYHGKAGRLFFGTSTVKTQARVTDSEPPSPGKWAGMKSYYRIDLRDFSTFNNPLSVPYFLKVYREELRADIVLNHPGFYPFTTRGPLSVQTVQGIYLAKASGVLCLILEKALALEQVAKEDSESQKTYVEERKLLKERYFFSRNPRLIADAKSKHGTICQTCKFDFEAQYGELGSGYIEAHHKNPLAERSDFESKDLLHTSIEDIAVLCSNCHRMIHRCRPAMSIEKLEQLIQKSRIESLEDGRHS